MDDRSSALGAKFFCICLLLLVIGFSWHTAIGLYRDHTEAILFQIADIAEAIALPYEVALLISQEEVRALPVPIIGVTPAMIEDSWSQPRSGGRGHEGVDIFAQRGTPVFSVTQGYVVHTGSNDLGGNIVFVLGPGGVRYYYAHLDRRASGIEFGTRVTRDTVLGFVGNTGNASTTPPHLHFGLYGRNGPENPYPLLISR